MRARPEVKRILISERLRKWAMVGRRPSAYPNISATRARRNYARLCARYPDIARSLGLDATSAYPPI